MNKIYKFMNKIYSSSKITRRPLENFISDLYVEHIDKNTKE